MLAQIALMEKSNIFNQRNRLVMNSTTPHNPPPATRKPMKNEAIEIIKRFIVDPTAHDENIDRHIDEFLLDGMASEMVDRLKAARESGRHGWWNDEVISVSGLESLLEKATIDKDYVSVANYAAMLWARKQIDPLT